MMYMPSFTMWEWVVLGCAIAVFVLMTGGPHYWLSKIKQVLKSLFGHLHTHTSGSQDTTIKPHLDEDQIRKVVSQSVSDEVRRVLKAELRVAQQVLTTQKPDLSRVLQILRAVSITLRQVASLTANPADDLLALLVSELVQWLSDHQNQINDLVPHLVKMLSKNVNHSAHPSSQEPQQIQSHENTSVSQTDPTQSDSSSQNVTSNT